MFHVDVNKLNGKIAERNTTKEAVADAIGVNRSTYYRRLKSSTLTIRDIHKICDVLRLSGADALEIFIAV